MRDAGRRPHRDASLRGQAVPVPRLYLAAHIAERRDGDPIKIFVCFLAAHAHDVLTGELPDEPRPLPPRPRERYARECLIPPPAFEALADRPDGELATYFNVPLEQITARRLELSFMESGVPTPRCSPPTWR